MGQTVALPRLVVRVDAARVAPWATSIGLGVMYALWSLWQFAHMFAPSWDNAIFEQAIKGYAHLGAPIADIKGQGFNLLGDHWSPALALIAPFYRVWPHAQTLLIVQAICLGASMFPIVRMAIRRLGMLPGVTVALAYGLSFGVLIGMASQFHEVALGVPLLAFAGEAFAERRWRAVVLWCLPLLLVKESFALLLVGVGLALVMVGARRLGVATMLLGVAAFAILVLVVIPAFNAGGRYDYTSGLGVGDLLRNLGGDLGAKAVTMLLTFGVTGFVALRSPWSLVVWADLAWRFIGPNHAYWGTGYQYSLVAMAVVFPALIDGAARVRSGWLRRWATQVPAVALTVAVVCMTVGPAAAWVRPVTPTAQTRVLERAMALIPARASVETDQLPALEQLVAGHTVYYPGTAARSPAPNYVLLTTDTWLKGYDPVKWIEGEHPGSVYTSVFTTDGITLLQLR